MPAAGHDHQDPARTAAGNSLELARYLPTPGEMVGQVLRDTYRIVHVLDHGGMGVVLDAEHLRLHRRVAVKILLAADDAALARFQREAEIVSQLSHPHIVQIIDYDTTCNNQPYIVMERLHGESLATRLDRDRVIPMSEAVRIAGQIASALSAAHQLSIVHRDLKPANVFLVNVPGEPPFVKLLDFGISKRVGAAQALTRDRDVLGTPDYMAPEQAVGHTGSADPRADQYALSVMVYEMLSGRLPFDGEDVLAVLYQVVHERAPALSEVAPPWVPRSVSDVVARAMAKRPDDRFETVVDFADALSGASGCSLPASLQKTSPALPLPPWANEPSSGPRSARSRRFESAPVTADPAAEVVAAVDQARSALGRGELDLAARYAETALEVAAYARNDDVEAAVELSTPALERVFEAKLGGLRSELSIERVPSAAETEMTSAEAFLISRVDGGTTVEEVLDLSPLPRLASLRLLTALLKHGVVRIA